jgi:hypothetical protein
LLARFEGREDTLEKAIATVCGPSRHFAIVNATADVPGAGQAALK